MEKVISRNGTALVTDTRSLATRITLVASATSLLPLATLHVLSPEFDPSWRMVREYAIGGYKWGFDVDGRDTGSKFHCTVFRDQVSNLHA